MKFFKIRDIENVARIWKEMTIILCITTTADTSHSKTILELSNDQSLYLLSLLSHYSLSLFYISVSVHQTRTSITSIPDVLSIHFFRQVSLKFFLFSQHDYKAARNAAFICVARSFKAWFKIFLFSFFNEFAFSKILKIVRVLFNSWRLIWFRCNFDCFDFEHSNKIMIIIINILHCCLKFNWTNCFISQWTMICL